MHRARGRGANLPPCPSYGQMAARHRTDELELSDATIDAIAERVAAQLRDRDDPPAAADGHEWLTAKQVAERFGVRRDWVYAHARELGGQRLGAGPRPRLRFDARRVAQALRADPAEHSAETPEKPTPARRSRPRAARLLPIRGAT